MLAAGHVRLVAVGGTLVEMVVVEEENAATGEDVETVEEVTKTADEGVDVVVGVVVKLDFFVAIGDVVVSGQEAPGLQGSIEQQPLNPFWQT
jgi:hypothetical protein